MTMTPGQELETKRAATAALGTVGKTFVNLLVWAIIGTIIFATLPVVCTFVAFCWNWWKAAGHALLG